MSRSVRDNLPPPRCPTCNGDDKQAPCAYPGENKPGCPRDKRLREQVAVEWPVYEEAKGG